ncbi:surfactant B protein, putative [Trichomonas vaginalis G3]|uniref:Surfactant B protein, putative n=1 Tax=Trichomonas vaginalis (strain ATCC PRA-98 / G3) TaxID=412133 RepID=A2FFY3_TRIV3|nr:ganglioside GM2 binding [Trichomonas vaginalis G3]EAX96193.1 surfactant B protein, putative [Trichomonas vaginalis G3]KAI5506297.1 ganglioside GM2 binding [Trichomonas vaginalis G3]|eukprot:XP_001309123.1 surfactant B protein [Trichomonas vaginalis G3]
MFCFLFFAKLSVQEDGCDLCHTALPLLRQAIEQGYSDDVIKSGLAQACPTMPSQYIPYCNQALQNIDGILADIHAGKDDDYVCKTYGFCTAAIKVRKANVDNGMICDVCVSLIKYVEKVLLETKVESEVIALCDKYCESLPAPFPTLCKSMVEKYVPVIIQYLEQGIEHLEICKKIGLCESVKGAKSQNGLICDMCVELVHYVEEVLDDTKIESEVAELADKFCEKFSAPYSTLCKSLVDKSIVEIMHWLEQGLEHLEVCQKVHLCSVQKSVVRTQNGIICDTCVTLVKYVEKLLDDQTVRSEIEHLVDQFCDDLPSPVSVFCKSIVDKYIDEIITYLEQGLEHLEICKKIGLCDTKLSAREANGAVCDMCTKLVRYIEELMESETVESEIAVLCEKLCDELPSPISSLCKGMVDKYVKIIMQWLEQGLEHLEVCQKLGFCDAKSLKLARNPVDFSATNGVTCDICKDFFKWSENEIEKYTVPYLWKLVHEKCPKIPYLATFCKLINEQNIETFLNLIISQLPPEKACHFIKLC